MKCVILCLLCLLAFFSSEAQLVRRKDYDAAFALQAGGSVGMLTAFQHPQVSVTPVGGMKMTFPFTRKWFLGSEVNYNRLKYRTTSEVEADFDLKQISVPLYLKYMLNCNKASVLFGFYGTYIFDSALNMTLEGNIGNGSEETATSVALEKWHAGLTVGYEHRIVKRLNIMCRVDVGLKEIVKSQPVWKDKLLPIQACLTLSYDILRIGDCECD